MEANDYQENYTTGWVRLYRSVANKWWFKRGDYLKVWIHLLLESTYREREYRWNGKTIMLQPGQFVTTRNAISEKTKVNRSSVDRILKCFENELQIEQQMSRTSRLISIVNYDSYQKGEPQVEPQMSHKRATVEPRLSTKQEGNKVISNKSTPLPPKPDQDLQLKAPSLENGHRAQKSDPLEYFDAFWLRYPKKKGKEAAKKAWIKLKVGRDLFTKIVMAVEQSRDKDPQWTKDGGQFIPHPATYLNGRRWEDEVQVDDDKEGPRYEAI